MNSNEKIYISGLHSKIQKQGLGGPYETQCYFYVKNNGICQTVNYNQRFLSTSAAPVKMLINDLQNEHMQMNRLSVVSLVGLGKFFTDSIFSGEIFWPPSDIE
ncbi:hypothetical protein AYI69_g354 [Smittium culicis]|uniref:Uncharacterized protein n=1 Tax=Smittium culicis TaxID=133412 RepID=A0A1R1YTA1_9FUNG|nr:hypothetical protein AYI69_g354 [Smittium culicis]